MSGQIAQTILQQLGGKRFQVMTGAKSFYSDGAALGFRVPSNTTKDHISAVKIILDCDDTYTMKTWALRGLKVREVSVDQGLYAEDLKRVFTSRTGLDTSL